ncbi:uncharacterized protein LAESUDRAFT_765604 [Laetiporus sulphureus 93-53]|uniref:HCP-like protein n=1 Tax=Laetiporus sulphureus 93-53 TaxID=1314785 RepID=A0A165AP32_9APHY|nr:uncharacterized protein LAESUDRAFT_765604 [Laetiporus sulphureus 93-53]KZS99385.1 hypothetical protein LAESUDRAFT_765604 [Laetiporus sulphureus 93-53]
MGYYIEVGVGHPKNIEVAQKWCTRGAEHGNLDASDHLKALSQPPLRALSHEQHKMLTDTTIICKCTLARQHSDAQHGVGSPRPQVSPAAQGPELINNLQHPMDPHAGVRSLASAGFMASGGYPSNLLHHHGMRTGCILCSPPPPSQPLMQCTNHADLLHPSPTLLSDLHSSQECRYMQEMVTQ